MIKIADKNRDDWLVVKFKSMRPMISPPILKMRRRLAKPKPPLRRSEKTRRVTTVTFEKI